MPKPRSEVRSRRTIKYAFPVVSSILDTVGPPREIDKLHKLEAGPMLVTLAVEVASYCAENICERLTMMPENELPADECLVPDLFEKATEKPGTAAHLLLTRNPRWWFAFASGAEKKFQALAKRSGPVRILLGNFAPNAAAEKLSREKKIRIDEAWLEIFKSPAEHLAERPPQDASSGALVGRWKPYAGRSGTLNDDDVRKWRCILGAEDKKQSQWIRSLAGCSHPCASSYWDEPMCRGEEYSAARAGNELYFCLSGGHAELFALEINEDFNRESWKRWLCQAAKGKPPYFRK